MMLEKFVRQRGTECFCPVEFNKDGTVTVVLGLSLLTYNPPGEVVGEFWFDEQTNQLQVELKKPDGELTLPPVRHTTQTDSREG